MNSRNLLAAFAFSIAVSVHAQDAPVPPPSEEPPPAETDQAPPTLDELLGLEKDDGAAEVADRKVDEELERRLNDEKIADAFTEVFEKMGIVADRLDKSFDTGLGTQRVQEEVLDKLTFLLDEAKKQQSSSSSSSSSQSQSQSQPQPKPEPKPQQQSSQPGQQDGAGDGQGGDPAPRQGDPNEVFDESRAEWGTLPERVREQLLQGRRDTFSSLYEQLTREYYRRLAEEGSR